MAVQDVRRNDLRAPRLYGMLGQGEIATLKAMIELTQKNVTLRNGRKISLLTPNKDTAHIGGVNNARGDYLLLSDGSGFALMSKLMTLAAGLRPDEMVHLPLGMKPSAELKKVYPNAFYEGAVLVGDTTESIALKDIAAALKARKADEQRIMRAYDVPEASYFEESWWKGSRKLVAVPLGKRYVVKADSDSYLTMACYCAGMATYGDDAAANLRAHQHFHDGRADAGLSFYYWHEK